MPIFRLKGWKMSKIFRKFFYMIFVLRSLNEEILIDFNLIKIFFNEEITLLWKGENNRWEISWSKFLLKFSTFIQIFFYTNQDFFSAISFNFTINMATKLKRTKKNLLKLTKTASCQSHFDPSQQLAYDETTAEDKN